MTVTISLGVSSTERMSGLTVVEAADRALYEAKRTGRDRVVAADTSHDIDRCPRPEGVQ